MYGKSFLLPFVGSGLTMVVAAAAKAATSRPIVPGAYLVEFEDNHVCMARLLRA